MDRWGVCDVCNRPFELTKDNELSNQPKVWLCPFQDCNTPNDDSMIQKLTQTEKDLMEL